MLPSDTRFLKSPGPAAVNVNPDIARRVEEMLADMERGGIEAVRRWSEELDGWAPESFVLTPDQIEVSSTAVDEDLRRHIAFAQGQVKAFAEAQRATLRDLEVEISPGVVLGHKHLPVAGVGAYVPGGRYPMFASSFMTVLVAKTAGVEQVVACGPPLPDGRGLHPAMTYAMATSGADHVVCLGGVQALAAMAFGLIDGVAPVDMLVGAGNAYVAEAKRQLFGRVGIDLLAGPTEVLVIADRQADPRLVAADVLGQAEHGPTSPAGVIAIGEDVARDVADQIEMLLTGWPTADVAGAAWRDHGWIAVAADHDDAIRLADAAANEHLEVHVDPDLLDDYLSRLRNYGSLFLGEEATVAYGDKGVGTNHVLPTSGAARYTGGLWVGKFLKTCTWQRLTAEGTRVVGPAIEAIAAAEGFAGHALTATYRLDRAGR